MKKDASATKARTLVLRANLLKIAMLIATATATATANIDDIAADSVRALPCVLRIGGCTGSNVLDVLQRMLMWLGSRLFLFSASLKFR